MNKVVRIKPLHYIHLQDLSTNITTVEVGPRSFILQYNHVLVKGPLPFVVIPPGHFCEIKDPVKKPCFPSKVHDLKHGFVEVHLHGEPFPLYPGEILVGATNDGLYRIGEKLLKVVRVEKAYTLKHNTGLHVKATRSCVDALGKKRNIGQEWLVTMNDAETYVPEVGEEAIKGISKTVLSKNQYCVVLDPVDENGVNQLGKKELRVGITSFFLHPGETLEAGIQDAYILGDDEALVLSALDYYDDRVSDTEIIRRTPGDRWMIHGPQDYIPPIQVKVEANRKAVPLSENSGIYVQNVHSGEVRAVLGPQSYLLKEFEELWEKPLSEEVEKMLSLGGGYGDGTDIRKLAYFESAINPEYAGGQRDKTKVVIYNCPKGTAVQVYNYKDNTARVIFGPDIVILEPYEKFNVLSLSAGKPKKEGALKSFLLMLGPDFITDIIEVETSDHARLRMKLGMNNHFEVDKGSDTESQKAIFSISDFIGFACRNVGGRIRGVVAQTPFDEFHRYSNNIIRNAVFGVDKDGKINKTLRFEANKLVITQIDVQSIEPVDETMRNSLMKSVQMAIEISTMSTEKAADHEAKRLEQIAKGLLERQKLFNKMEAEQSRKTLAEFKAITAAVESCGQSKAEAQAKAEKLLIEGQCAIEVARLKAEAVAVQHEAELETKQKQRESEIRYKQEKDKLEIEKTKLLSSVEVAKFSSIISAIGQDTLAEIASDASECQAKLLQGLGITNVLITDGTTPINMMSGPNHYL